MTPYEISLAKKLTQAVELSSNLSKWAELTDNEMGLEEKILQALIAQVDAITQQFNLQLLHYSDRYEMRRQMAVESDRCLKQLNEHLWEDVNRQFTEGTLARDLVKVFYQKIHRLALPAFPSKRRLQVLHKDVRFHEDAYDLFGNCFSGLLNLLPIIKFRPTRFSLSLDELHEQVYQFNSLTEQLMIEAESLRKCQLEQQQLFKQLNQVVNSVKGRLVIYKREARWITTD